MKKKHFIYYVLLCAYQIGSAQPKIDRIIVADSLANLGKFDQAEFIYRTELGIDSACWRCYFGLAGIETIREHHDIAVEMYSQTLKLQHRSFIYQRRAQSYYYLENMDSFCTDTDSALAIYRRAGEDLQPEEKDIKKEMERMQTEVCDQNKPSYYIHRGLAALNRGDSTAIATAYEQGITRFPEDAALRNFQGNFYRNIGDETKARENYRYVLAHLDNLRAYLKNSAAITEPEQIDLFIAETYMGLAATYFRERSFDEAEKIMKDMIATLPNAPKYAESIASFYNFYGEIWLNKKEYRQAKEAFQHALDLNKSYAVAYANYALTIMTEVLAREEMTHTFRLGFALSQQGQQFNGSIPFRTELKYGADELVTALQFINKAIKLVNDDPDLYWVRGDIKYLLGMSDFCLDYQTAKTKGNPYAQVVIDERCK